MKKTMTVNISGIVFNIDEDAYLRLNRYLDRIRSHFSDEYGGEEIISGIEERIAELFQDRKKAPPRVVSIDDVEEAIRQLGEPSQISGDDKDTQDKKEDPGKTSETYTHKQLFRDPDNKYIGGVCGGLAAYFNIDPTWIRLIFVLFLFLYASSILVYIVLWIVIPKARTTADRLSMRGEKINLSNIEKSIKEDLQDIKKNLENLSKQSS
ncbi:MAG: PspC domain-containing protein [Bacteroidales bacterium]|nr:PspC domain-containing protein [Bacteroidales bacterium]